jgi:hypothetical protein
LFVRRGSSEERLDVVHPVGLIVDKHFEVKRCNDPAGRRGHRPRRQNIGEHDIVVANRSQQSIESALYVLLLVGPVQKPGDGPAQ